MPSPHKRMASRFLMCVRPFGGPWVIAVSIVLAFIRGAFRTKSNIYDGAFP